MMLVYLSPCITIKYGDCLAGLRCAGHFEESSTGVSKRATTRTELPFYSTILLYEEGKNMIHPVEEKMRKLFFLDGF